MAHHTTSEEDDAAERAEDLARTARTARHTGREDESETAVGIPEHLRVHDGTGPDGVPGPSAPGTATDKP